MKDILLLGKRIVPEKSEILLSGTNELNWTEKWQVMGGKWSFEDGILVGEELGNCGGILFTRDCYEDDVMISCKISSYLPATRDLNALYCAYWDEKTDYLKSAYICGVNGWYDGKSGIERFPENGLNTTTTLYKYTPGTEISLCAGAINGHNFITVDGELVTELIDPNPLKGGHVGFSPYCTKLKIRDIEIRKIYWEKRDQAYDPEF